MIQYKSELAYHTGRNHLKERNIALCLYLVQYSSNKISVTLADLIITYDL